MLCCSTAVATLDHRSSPGSSGGGHWFISAIGRLAATSMYQNGATNSSAVPPSTR
jgi:hypothetical protein